MTFKKNGKELLFSEFLIQLKTFKRSLVFGGIILKISFINYAILTSKIMTIK